ncbi:MAG TPA: pyridoxine 5'-phosphate synthase [Candidatus Ozemobacteraceae bacterium]|nr:pyridoxine 5'-phosphate synthase [Candidatus Ozemobacteraceae bacterium]HQG28125.1 pyridoxine 5'-phosphate synthase [Candidatus Ozemobacteraceae bacterium]
MIKLGVNIDHVATIRQARLGREPDPVGAAALAELAGADGITVHLREDRRHIQDRDAKILRQTVRTRLNLEMAVNEEIVRFATELKPDMATLVPERRLEVTTEGGLDVAGHFDLVKSAVERLQKVGITVSLFVDPNEAQVEASAKTGATFVELHTGRYADAMSEAEHEGERQKLYDMAARAKKLGLRVNAGHGITYWNVHDLVGMPGLEEFNIGHSIISRAVLVGLGRAVSDMKHAIREAELPDRT